MPETRTIDFDIGLRRCFGRQELLTKLLRRFVEEYHGHGQQIQRELAAGHTRAAATLAHSLVSTAGSLGADPLSQMARRLQELLLAGETDAAQPLAVALATEQQRLCAEAAAWLQSHT